MSEENVIGEINIKITDSDVEYTTELGVVDIVFWLDVLKAMILKNVVDNGSN